MEKLFKLDQEMFEKYLPGKTIPSKHLLKMCVLIQLLTLMLF